MVKNPLAKAGDTRDVGSIPGSGRSPGEGNGNPLQVFLPGEFHGQRSLADYSPWSHKESDMTELLTLSLFRLLLDPENNVYILYNLLLFLICYQQLKLI